MFDQVLAHYRFASQIQNDPRMFVWTTVAGGGNDVNKVSRYVYHLDGNWLFCYVSHSLILGSESPRAHLSPCVLFR